LPTQSGKFEFVAQSLRRFEAEDPERPALNRYLASWEGRGNPDQVVRFPLQLITAHRATSFSHLCGRQRSPAVSDIRDHRILVGGFRYWVVRINEGDAAKRGIRQHDLVKVHKPSAGAVICAADVDGDGAAGRGGGLRVERGSSISSRRPKGSWIEAAA